MREVEKVDLLVTLKATVKVHWWGQLWAAMTELKSAVVRESAWALELERGSGSM